MVSNRHAPELEARHTPLKGPRAAVHVEDSAAQEIAEDGGEGPPFGVVVEALLEDVLNIVWVGSYGVAQHVDVDGSRWRVAKEMSVPIAEVVELCGPTHGHVAPAGVAVAPWLHPRDEDEEGEEGEEEGEGEEQEAEGGGRGL